MASHPPGLEEVLRERCPQLPIQFLPSQQPLNGGCLLRTPSWLGALTLEREAPHCGCPLLPAMSWSPPVERSCKAALMSKSLGPAALCITQHLKEGGEGAYEGAPWASFPLPKGGSPRKHQRTRGCLIKKRTSTAWAECPSEGPGKATLGVGMAQ